MSDRDDPNWVYFKPYIGCLFTHQAAWDFLKTIVAPNGKERDVFECIKCQVRFYYPTSQDEPPEYK